MGGGSKETHGVLSDGSDRWQTAGNRGGGSSCLPGVNVVPFLPGSQLRRGGVSVLGLRFALPQDVAASLSVSFCGIDNRV